MSRRSLAALLTGAMMLGIMPAYAADVDMGENLDMGESVSVTTITDPGQVSELIAENWQGDYFAEMTIDPDAGEVQKDGEDVSLKEELDISAKKAESVMSSAESAESYINEQTDYAACTDDDGVVHVTAPYQTCRIVLNDVKLGGDYGASAILYDPDYEQYTLQFDSEAQTEAAWEKLTEEVGTDRCYVDQVLTLDMMTQGEEISTSSAGGSVKSWGTSWMGLNTLKSEAADYGYTGTNVKVAILDTGIEKGHEMFAGRKITGYNFANHGIEADPYYDPKDYSDTDPFQDADPDCEDGNKGHGTHVAGIIADATPANVSLMMLRVFDEYGYTSNEILDSALKYAKKKGADIVSVSLGELSVPDWFLKYSNKYGLGFSQSYLVYDGTLNDLYDSGITVVCAAGNKRGTDVSDQYGISMDYPAASSATIAVAALDTDGTAATFSSYGWEVDFAAPGVDIRSAKRASTNKYVKMQGTSMATPAVSAACALIKMAHPEYTPAQIKKVLISYSEDLGSAGKDIDYGYGAPRLKTYYEDDAAGTDLGSIADLSVKYTRLHYTGLTRANPVTVTLSDGTVLKKGTDYTVSYGSAKKIGIATATVTGIGSYTGRLEQTFTVIPEIPEKLTLKNTASGTLRVRWNEAKSGSGYQIEYARNRSFTNAKKITVSGRSAVSRTISGLGQHKYYVRVRVYKTFNHEKLYGRWSDSGALTLAS